MWKMKNGCFSVSVFLLLLYCAVAHLAHMAPTAEIIAPICIEE